MKKFSDSSARRFGYALKFLMVLFPCVVVGGILAHSFRANDSLPEASTPKPTEEPARHSEFTPRRFVDTSGNSFVTAQIPPWGQGKSLQDLSEIWKNPSRPVIEKIDQELSAPATSAEKKISLLVDKASAHHFDGEVAKASKALEEARALAESTPKLSHDWLYHVIYYQGITGLRRGETENCVMCRGESSCILPISSAAKHLIPEGSRMAIKHFTEYLKEFPDDLEIRWLLNIAHMTLGEYPEKVDAKYLVPLDHWTKSEFNIGKFRDIGARVGVNRLNQAGGAVMEDFDNDGLLDLAVTSWDPTVPMVFYRNQGDGTFADRSKEAGVSGQLGGLYCVQTDYNNDGLMDIFIPRGAWIPYPMRPSLLKNLGGGVFTDVTQEAGLSEAVNSNSAAWADYDNDGWLDVFVCCERQANRLYHNKKDGTFEEVAEKVGIFNDGQSMFKGAVWIDHDNDGDLDLFLNCLSGDAKMYKNFGNGKFELATIPLGIKGPKHGFSCWAWDYDNDGFFDIFATCYDRDLSEVVKGLMGQPHRLNSNVLFRNVEGRKFVDVTKEAGLDMVFATMGSNYADFDNDGFLDMYLGTGAPGLETLVPNRMFKNVEGKRFAEITASSGTGHLQKGHGVACGDWDRDGDIDIFEEMGGALNGDKYHNILFENPGQGNHWLTVKLVGKTTNRAAIGARIKVVTGGETPRTVHRHVSSGSSFGATPLRQTIGLGQSGNVATLEIQWPTSKTTQVFHDITADQAIEITEFADTYQTLDSKPVPAAPEP